MEENWGWGMLWERGLVRRQKRSDGAVEGAPWARESVELVVWTDVDYWRR